MPTGVYTRKPRKPRKRLTRAQKQTISERLRAFHANKRGDNGTTRTARDGGEATDAQAAYALGRIEGWIAAYADGLGVSGHTLTGRVADLLRASARRKGMGT